MHCEPCTQGEILQLLQWLHPCEDACGCCQDIYMYTVPPSVPEHWYVGMYSNSLCRRVPTLLKEVRYSPHSKCPKNCYEPCYVNGIVYI